jgi:fluoroquinolone transport system permease protein
MIGGAKLIMRFSGGFSLPNIPLLLLGIVAMGILYTLIGIVLVVRYSSITDYLLPMAGVAVILQLPFLYFLGWVEHWSFLLIPTSAPTVLMVGAYRSLAGWEWVYGVGYTAVLLIGLSMWAYRAFQTHVIEKVG